MLAGFGEDRGIDAFQHAYKLKDSNDPFWHELQNVLRLGGTFSDDRATFTAPYVASCWPEKFDTIDFAALTGKNIIVRDAPGAEGKEVARLSYSIIKLAPTGQENEKTQWSRIHLPSGGIGYVDSSLIRSASDYRAKFRRTGTRWTLTSFVAGD